MKLTITFTLGALLFAATILIAHSTFAQQTQVITTTTTSDGTISEFGSDRMLIKTTTAADPLSYSFSKTTTYVDENGTPVAVETVKSGVPVTVYYTRTGDALVASKVVVRTSASAPTPMQATRTSAGTITDFGIERLTIKSDITPDFFTFHHNRSTLFVDENNLPVSTQLLLPGAHIVVHFTQANSLLTAVKVIVKGTPSVVVEKKTTTTTTTTNEK